MSVRVKVEADGNAAAVGGTLAADAKAETVEGAACRARGGMAASGDTTSISSIGDTAPWRDDSCFLRF